MSRVHSRIGAIALVTVLLFSSMTHAAFASKESPKTDTVVLVLTPYLTWDDVMGGNASNLRSFAENGAVANLNTVSRNRLALRRDNPAQGALTYSSGTWAATDPRAAEAYSVDERIAGGLAKDVYSRVMGLDPGDAAVVFLGLPRTQRLNDRSPVLDVKIGSLGQAIVEAGGATAAIGNSDFGLTDEEARHRRPAAMVAMDTSGKVRFGDVSQRLLKGNPFSPFDVAADLEKYRLAFKDAVRSLQAAGGPGLVVVDPGDLTRAEHAAHDFAPKVAAAHRNQAIRSLDAMAGMAAAEMPPGAVLMIVSSTAPVVLTDRSPFAPFILFAPGQPDWSGTAISSSTKQPGLVTNLDVAATVTSLLGVERPVFALGNPVIPKGDNAPLSERIETIQHRNAVSVAIEGVRAPAINGFIVLTMLVFGISVLVLFRMKLFSERARSVTGRAARISLLLILAAPAASTLMFTAGLYPTTPTEAILTFVALTLALGAIASMITLSRYTRLALGTITLATAFLLLLDQWLGGPWSFTGILGFSPLVAARYYGLGNEGAAILIGALIVGSALLFDEFASTGKVRSARRWLLPVVGLTAVFTASAPFFGANVAVALWGLVAIGIFWAQVNRVRINWKFAVAVLGAAIVMIAGFALVDISAEKGVQTHLGRALESARQGGLGELWTIVERKAATNLRVLTTTNWSFVLVGVLFFLGYMRWRPQGDFAATLRENPAFSAALTALLSAGAVAYLTEDSGIVIPALMLVYVGAGILYLMIGRLAFQSAIQPEENGDTR